MSRPVTFELASLRTMLALMAGAAGIAAVVAIYSVFAAGPAPTSEGDGLRDTVLMLASVFGLFAIGCGWGARGITRQLERLPVEQ